MTDTWTRRELMRRGTAAWAAGTVAGSMLSSSSAAAAAGDEPPPATGIQKPQATPGRAAPQPGTVRYCLNTSTIRGQNVPLPDEIDLAAKAGYQAIEPWIREIDQYLQTGGTLRDLRKRIEDRGLQVASAIGFAEWIVDNDEQRQKGLEEARRTMDLVAQLGGTRIAAPPTGAVKQSGMDLLVVAGRYRQLLELGRSLGVVPQLEVWGFSQTLGRLGESTLVAIESQHPDACLLPDVYHLYKGGSEFAGLRLLSGQAIQVFHMNDYPAAPPRAEISDAHRVYPGDGVAPLTQILRDLWANGFQGTLSLELFNRDYWQQDALTVARTGLEKMQQAVARSLA